MADTGKLVMERGRGVREAGGRTGWEIRQSGDKTGWRSESLGIRLAGG
jgi:hypothetical protein